MTSTCAVENFTCSLGVVSLCLAAVFIFLASSFMDDLGT